MRFRACLGFVLILGLAELDAQTGAIGTVRGVVLDTQERAIAAATVEIRCRDAVRTIQTARDGRFQETGLPGPSCMVTASSESFEPESIRVDPSRNHESTFVLRVRRLSAEVVVSPARGDSEAAFEVPESTSVVSRRDIETRPYTLLGQVLREEPGILLQQTTSAQVSPIIRGFTGQSNVYLLDGVRLNTAAWRTGPSQYLSWVDGGPIESIEVIRGAGSVQYGSDALGGTIQLLSESTFTTSREPVTGSVELFGSSADQSFGGQADIGFRLDNTTVRIGGSHRKVNDLRGGNAIDSHSAITRFFGLSSTLVDDRDPDTSFSQGGVYVVAQGGAGRGGIFRGMYMHENQTDASRYDRLLGGEGLFRSGFDPQTLDFGLFRYSRANVAGFHGVTAVFSVNRQADGRFEQARPTTRVDQQEATTTAFGYQLQANRDFGTRQHLLIGGELYDESIGASRQLVETNGTVTASRPDIPDGTSYANFGVFAQHALDVVPNRVSVRGGVRYGRHSFSTTPDSTLGVIEDNVTTQAVTFQAATVVSLTQHLNLTGNVTRGFRAANAADLGAIGLSGGGGFEITPERAVALDGFVGSTGAADAVNTGVPVGDLQAEVVYQYEVGLKGRTRRVSGSINAFDLELYDFIQRRAIVFTTNVVGTEIAGFEIVSQDASGLAYIAEDARPIATRVNVDRARIHGFDAEGEVRLHREWTAHAYFSMANGRTSGGEFVRRMPPPLGGARLRWARSQVWVEGALTFASDQTRLNSADLTDARIGATRSRTSIATFFNGTATDMGLVSGGVLQATGETLAQVQNRVLGSASSAPLFTKQPGFAVFGLRAGVRIAGQFDVTAIAENLGDTNYRLYGSGVDAPGFNVQLRTRYRF